MTGELNGCGDDSRLHSHLHDSHHGPFPVNPNDCFHEENCKGSHAAFVNDTMLNKKRCLTNSNGNESLSTMPVEKKHKKKAPIDTSLVMLENGPVQPVKNDTRMSIGELPCPHLLHASKCFPPPSKEEMHETFVLCKVGEWGSVIELVKKKP